MIEVDKKKSQLEEGYKLSPTGEIVPDYDTTIKYFDEGDVIKGTVVQIDRDEVLVDVGYKSEGVIPLQELAIKLNNPEQVCKVGDEVETLVMQKEDSEGRLILSKKRADFEKSWDKIEKASKDDSTVKGTVVEIVKGGLILNIGVRSFLPASLIDLNRQKDLDQYIDQEMECKIIEINRSRNNVVLSRKAVLSNDRQSEKKELLDKLETGKKVGGKVSSIVDFGAFIDLGGIDGLIHISEISWEHINHPSEILSLGQEVEVIVLDIDNEKARVSLGLKQTQDDPWKEKLKGCEIGDDVKGKVTKILPFGVFIEFGEDLEGLVHISELSCSHVVNPKEVVDIGDELETKLIGIDLSRRRISLSAKKLEEEKTGIKAAEEDKKKAAVKTSLTKKEEDKEAKTQSKTEKEDEKAKAARKDTETKEDAKVEESKEEGKQDAEVKTTKTEKPATSATEQKVKTKTVKEEDSDSEQKTDKSKTEVKEETKEETKKELDEKSKIAKEEAKEATKPSEKVKKEGKKTDQADDDKALLDRLSKSPEKEKEKPEDDMPDSSSLEDVLEQMKKSHGEKK